MRSMSRSATCSKLRAAAAVIDGQPHCQISLVADWSRLVPEAKVESTTDDAKKVPPLGAWNDGNFRI